MLCKLKCDSNVPPFSFIEKSFLLRKGFFLSTMQEITFLSCGFVSYKILIPFALDGNEILYPLSATHPIGYLY